MRYLLLALLLTPVASAQVIPAYDQIPEPQPYEPCGLEVVAFGQGPVGFENLHFLNGTLYLTAFADGLYQATPDGRVSFIVKDDPDRSGPEMMGVTSHDGVLYVSQGLSVTEAVDGRIIRFPVPGEPHFEVHAEGFDGGNGLVATADGSLYMAHGFRQEIYHVAPDGSSSVWAEGRVPNGLDLHPNGDQLVIGQVAEAGSGVEAWALEDPTQRVQLFAFNAVNSGSPTDSDPTRPIVPHLMDDVTVTSDGRVLLASHERMRTLMGDPSTGEACVLTEHDDSPTSVRIATGFGKWDGYAFTVDLTGAIQAVDLGAAPSDVGQAPTDGDAGVEKEGARESPASQVGVLLLAVLAVAAIGSRRS